MHVASVELARGFTAVGYMGPAGGSVADFAQSLGAGVVAIFRFNAGAQQFESYRTDGPAFLNSLTTVNPGDALLVQSPRRYPAELTNGGTLPSSVRRERGANFATYHGPAASIADVLGGIAGLSAAFVFDAPTQPWRSWRPQGPGFLNQVTDLATGTPLVLVMDRPGELQNEPGNRERPPLLCGVGPRGRAPDAPAAWCTSAAPRRAVGRRALQGNAPPAATAGLRAASPPRVV